MAIKYRRSVSPGKKWNRIKRIRQHLRMSQPDLSRECGFSTQYLVFMEGNGSIGNNPSPEIREKIRQAFSKRLGVALTLDEIWPANICDKDVEVMDMKGMIF